MILVSSPRPQPVRLTLMLPPGASVVARFFDDGSVRDLTAGLPDLLLEFLLRTSAAADPAEDPVQVAEVYVEGGSWADCQVELRDLLSGAASPVPSDALPVLVGSAVAMAVVDALGS